MCTFMHTDINLNEKTLSGSSEEFNQENKLGYKTEVELHKGDRLFDYQIRRLCKLFKSQK